MKNLKYDKYGGKKRSLKIYNFNVKKWEKKVGKIFNVGPGRWGQETKKIDNKLRV